MMPGYNISQNDRVYIYHIYIHGHFAIKQRSLRQSTIFNLLTS